MNGYMVVTRFLHEERTKIMRENGNPSAYFIRMDVGTYAALLGSEEARAYCRIEQNEMTVHGHIIDVWYEETDAPVLALLPLTHMQPGKTVDEIRTELWHEEQNITR